MDYAVKMAAPYRPPSDLSVSEIERCIDLGMSSFEAADSLRVRRNGLLKQCYRLGIRWPYDPATRHRKVWAYGRWWSFAEIARTLGVRREIIRNRWQRGQRGEALFGRPRRYNGGAFELGVSVSDWNTITADAERCGVSEAARKYDVPAGAIRAAMIGEWGRLG